MKKSKIQIYDVLTLEEIAKAFLDKYDNSDSLEVDIEYIIENKLEWKIIGVSFLREKYCIEAYFNKNKELYVDSFLMDSRERRYRFTLAEEVAHHIIHRDIYAQCANLEEHLEIYGKITANEYHSMERNAKYLASAIIMPSISFEKQAIKICKKINKKEYETNQEVLYKIALTLSNDFNVSDEAARIRFIKLGLQQKLITL